MRTLQCAAAGWGASPERHHPHRRPCTVHREHRTSFTADANGSGTGIQGGREQKMSKGDFMLIPQGVPHWITNVQGAFTPMTLHLPMAAK
jgi:quercetin dioxygenase-like cupin family protein